MNKYLNCYAKGLLPGHFWNAEKCFLKIDRVKYWMLNAQGSISKPKVHAWPIMKASQVGSKKYTNTPTRKKLKSLTDYQDKQLTIHLPPCPFKITPSVLWLSNQPYNASMSS
jgi:hypothetical protein